MCCRVAPATFQTLSKSITYSACQKQSDDIIAFPVLECHYSHKKNSVASHTSSLRSCSWQAAHLRAALETLMRMISGVRLTSSLQRSLGSPSDRRASFPFICRSISTSAPDSPRRPKAGRSRQISRMPSCSISVQQQEEAEEWEQEGEGESEAALPPSHYWSITKSSWRGGAYEPSGCEDPCRRGCLTKCL